MPMTHDERSKFIEYLDSVISGSEMLLRLPTQADNESVAKVLRRKIRAAKIIKEEIENTEVMEGTE
ncbi:MAG: hypothetical protein CVT81_08160 [Alphaproteobacteria bacterium HGW-Alphaproteobacteria-3]|nr:MAG: hypothetical protein CVT81_08160 [Alphaproteobacteria bacterium HGW-Alphaproteobacteria-3]